MYEGKSLCMKSQPSERIGLSPVFPVAGDRVSDPLRMDADLVLPSSLELELDYCIRLS